MAILSSSRVEITSVPVTVSARRRREGGSALRRLRPLRLLRLLRLLLDQILLRLLLDFLHLLLLLLLLLRLLLRRLLLLLLLLLGLLMVLDRRPLEQLLLRLKRLELELLLLLQRLERLRLLLERLSRRHPTGSDSLDRRLLHFLRGLLVVILERCVLAVNVVDDARGGAGGSVDGALLRLRLLLLRLLLLLLLGELLGGMDSHGIDTARLRGGGGVESVEVTRWRLGKSASGSASRTPSSAG